LKPKTPLANQEVYGLQGDWTLSVGLPNAKTSGTLNRWDIAADVQCTTLPPTHCTPSDIATCLNGGRFEVSMVYRTGQNVTGLAHASQLTPDTGWFWFFDQKNVEVVLKVLNGCGVNGRYWVYASGLTDVQVTITVRDWQTLASKTYFNPLGQAFQPIFDVDAFPCP
jgi:hypothetical protein